MGEPRAPEPPLPPQSIEPPGVEAKMDPRPRYAAPGYRGADKLAGKAALISGGDSGIGRAVAVLFAREGADVAFTHLPEEKTDADETARAIDAEGARALPIELDVRTRDDCARAVRRTLDAFDRLDVLVNNAAFQNHVDSFDALDEAQWEKTFRTNVDGYFHLTKAALPHLPRGGAIVNTGSITGLEGSSGLVDYSATKGAIHAFTKSLAKALVDRGVRVNCVAPGPVWTPLNPAERKDEEVESFGGQTPFGRPAQPEEIAPAYVYFASDVDSSYVTGEVLTLLGGDTRAG
ncbi:MAG TPA: SDR family oxidoreductase [Sandaracinaceae bacterium LLY-WYZ-13_1]|nr:SDR family oxidoreductase [Sandaracinaceae bacterium LLY-WYZ-13_1]